METQKTYFIDFRRLVIGLCFIGTGLGLFFAYVTNGGWHSTDFGLHFDMIRQTPLDNFAHSIGFQYPYYGIYWLVFTIACAVNFVFMIAFKPQRVPKQ